MIRLDAVGHAGSSPVAPCVVYLRSGPTRVFLLERFAWSPVVSQGL